MQQGAFVNPAGHLIRLLGCAAFSAIFYCSHACGASVVDYQLIYALSEPNILKVGLTFDQALDAPATFVIARTYPGGYAQIPYDRYVSEIVALDSNGQKLEVRKDADGPRWQIGAHGNRIVQIRYRVDVKQMETQTHDAVATSKIRPAYVGVLGQSVFGYVEGEENQPIRLQVDVPPAWPVMTSLAPKVPPAFGTADANAEDFYDLADSQIMMGPQLRVISCPGVIPLWVAVYAESPVDIQLEGRLAREALDAVQAYFGDTPIGHYTVQLELLKPLTGHGYGFSQEHVASGTFSLSQEAAVTRKSTAQLLERRRFNYAHHMAHSWIPKRAYGVGYRPFSWELTPVMDTIWFNEGFGRYAAIQALADTMSAELGKTYRLAQLAGLHSILNSAPPFIRKMPLSVLSREASFLYAEDFRTGKSIFARGALMAAEIDDAIRAQSGGSKSLRDALRGLLRWSELHRQPFQTEDLHTIFAAATGVDIETILQRWQLAQEE